MLNKALKNRQRKKRALAVSVNVRYFPTLNRITSGLEIHFGRCETSRLTEGFLEV